MINFEGQLKTSSTKLWVRGIFVTSLVAICKFLSIKWHYNYVCYIYIYITAIVKYLNLKNSRLVKQSMLLIKPSVDPTTPVYTNCCWSNLDTSRMITVIVASRSKVPNINFQRCIFEAHIFLQSTIKMHYKHNNTNATQLIKTYFYDTDLYYIE